MPANNKKLNAALAKYGLQMRHTKTAKSRQECDEIKDKNNTIRRRVSIMAGKRVNPGLLGFDEEDDK
jgi:hypothetical protein